MAGWVSVRSLCATVVALVGAAAGAPAAWATFPGLNGQLAYEAGSGATRNVFAIQPLAGSARDVTPLKEDNARAPARDAAWSADGRRIAFMSERDGNPEIYVMNSDGSGQRRLTRDPAVDADPAFSRDGTRLAFTSTRDGNPEIYVMADDGSAQTRLTFDPAADQQADWSPDGTRIAFESTRDGNHEIYTMNPDGGAVTRLTFSSEFAADPSWHPDGASIAFVSGPSGALNIFTLRPGTAGRTQLTDGLSDVHHPAWSPDGQQIAFTASGSTYVRKVDASGIGEVAAYGADAAWGPLPPPLPVPRLSETVNLRPLVSTEPVFVRVEGAEAAARLGDPREIPVGSPKGEDGTVIDTRKGALVLDAATPNQRSTSSVVVSEGRATLSQTDRGVSVLRLPRYPCGAPPVRLRTQTHARTVEPSAAPYARSAKRRRKGKTKHKSPDHGDASGDGTEWTTIRTCRKTTVRVHSGVVTVRDRIRDETVRVGDCRRQDRDCLRRDRYVIRARR
jgi:dipeptidyl aminopeptidase/acylaminoacyl peptidase